MTKTLTLKRRSLCACGFPAMKGKILLGTEYQVKLPVAVVGFDWICGGCGEVIPVIGVLIESKDDSPAGFMPLELFEETN